MDSEALAQILPYIYVSDCKWSWNLEKLKIKTEKKNQKRLIWAEMIEKSGKSILIAC